MPGVHFGQGEPSDEIEDYVDFQGVFREEHQHGIQQGVMAGQSVNGMIRLYVKVGER